MQIYLEGKFVEEEVAKVSIFEPGFLYAQGLFETMRSYNGKVFRLDSHIERLVNSAPLINLSQKLDAESLKNIVKETLLKNNLKDGYVRLTVWEGKDQTHLSVLAKPYDFFRREDYLKGFKAGVSGAFRQNEFSLLSRIKSSNYLHLLLSYQEAKKNKLDERILLNTQGYIAEASRANIFLIKDNCLLTPSLDCGCLAGITRDTVLGIAQKEKIKVIETRITCEDLKKSREAFLTNSLIEVMPLVSLDGSPINKGKPGKITEAILRDYRKLNL